MTARSQLAADIGRRIRELRRLESLSQRDLQERTGIPYQDISKYENGHKIPSVPSILRLAEAMYATADDLLYDGER